MNTPKHRGPRDDGAMSETMESLLMAAAVVLMLGSMAFMALLISTGFATPQVGDVVVFRAGAPVADMTTATAQRLPQPQTSCVLNPAVMAQRGGSLVVERSVQHAQRYQVHWAGGRTAAGAKDCGHSADLVLAKADLRSLLDAVGGRGIAGRGDVF